MASGPDVEGLQEAVEELLRDVASLEDAAAEARILSMIEVVEGATVGCGAVELYYPLGLLYYNIPTQTSQTEQLAEEWLRRAVAEDGGDPYRRFALGALLFDQARYGEAMAQLSRIPGGSFGVRGQRWRDAKVSECVLCCELMRHPESLAPQRLDEVVEMYRKLSEVEAPVPVELGVALAQQLARVEPTPEWGQAVLGYIELVNSLGFRETLAPLLLEIEGWWRRHSVAVAGRR